MRIELTYRRATISCLTTWLRPQRKTAESNSLPLQVPQGSNLVGDHSPYVFHCPILSAGSGTNSSQTLIALESLGGLVPIGTSPSGKQTGRTPNLAVSFG